MTASASENISPLTQRYIISSPNTQTTRTMKMENRLVVAGSSGCWGGGR